MPSAIAPSPWYKHRWPWILIGMLGVSVCLSLTMVSIAVRNPDSLVNDNYYDAGKGINRSLERELLAQTLDLQGELRLDELTGEVQLRLTGDSAPPTLELNLISPTQPHKDRKVALARRQDGLYVGHLDDRVEGRRFVELLGSQEGRVWRVFEEEQVAHGVTLRLGDEALQGAEHH